jgi:hypothetical protein
VASVPVTNPSTPAAPSACYTTGYNSTYVSTSFSAAYNTEWPTAVAKNSAYIAAYTAAYTPLIDPNGANYQGGAVQGNSDGEVAGNHDGTIVLANISYTNGYDSGYDDYYDSGYESAYNTYFYNGYNDGYNIGETAGQDAAPCVTADAVKGAARPALASPRLIGVGKSTTGTFSAAEREVLGNLVAPKDKNGKTLSQRLLTTQPDPNTDKATTKNPGAPAGKDPASFNALTQSLTKLGQSMTTKRATLKQTAIQTLEQTKGIANTSVSQ